RQKHGRAFGSNGNSYLVRVGLGVPREAAPRHLLRCQNRQAAEVFDQQLHPSRAHHRTDLQTALAGGTVPKNALMRKCCLIHLKTSENAVKTQIWIAISV